MQVAFNNEQAANQLIDRAAATRNPFDAKYSKVEDADWETCSTSARSFLRPRNKLGPQGLNGHLQLDRIIRSVNDILLRPQIALRRLHRRVPEQHLDLLQFAAGSATQFCSRPPAIMRRDSRAGTQIHRLPPLARSTRRSLPSPTPASVPFAHARASRKDQQCTTGHRAAGYE